MTVDLFDRFIYPEFQEKMLLLAPYIKMYTVDPFEFGFYDMDIFQMQCDRSVNVTSFSN